MENTTSRFPRLPESAWWGIRQNLRQSVPGKIDAIYVASKLNMSEDSAKSNVLRALRAMGLVDIDSKPTARALRWRDDAHYREVCEEIAADVYDSELLNAFPGPDIDRKSLERWFALRAGVGQSAAKQMAALYSLIAAGDPAGQDSTASKATSKSSARGKPTAANRPSQNGRATKTAPQATNGTDQQHIVRNGSPTIGPSLHIDIQVHIAPDASAEQIDRIFSSMAEHLYQRKAE